MSGCMLASDASRVTPLPSTAGSSTATDGERAVRWSICHVVAPAEVGGLESVVLAMAARQRRAGHEVLVAAIVGRRDASQHWQEALLVAGVDVVPLVSPGRSYLGQWRAVTELLRRRGPSVVHTHGYHADIIGGLAARRLGLSTVTTVHGFTSGGAKRRVYQHLQRRAFRKFDAVMPVARTVGADLARHGVAPTKLHVVPNGFSADIEPLPRAVARRELAVGLAEQRVGWIGRLSVEKGPDIMIRALAMLPPAVRLSMFGDGAQRGTVERLARRLGVDSRITWHGVIPWAARFARAFDVLVLSSRSEGTPIALFEAMAAGVPVVATRVGGIPDIVTDAEAILVEPDDPAGLAAAIAATLRDSEAATTRVTAARRRLEEAFAIEPWLARIDSVYASVVRDTQIPDRQ
jgi:glycosyltransferase involved in cell wall biosynthesis